MSITLNEILSRLDTDEPDYQALAAFGHDAVPHLAALVRGADPGVAAKAAYLASLIEGDESLEVIDAAASSPYDDVRVAAAAGLRNLAPEQAAAAADKLLEDKDAGVRKCALNAVAELGVTGLELKIKRLSTEDPEKSLRGLAKEGLRKLGELRKVEAGQPEAPAPETRKTATGRKKKRGGK